ncbi:putative lipid particle protein [Lyophyllum shimeji]|uniref:Lipid particle protein n=1 Tax=Lyophyllum shimeji TaxID=47721 RepID=A0A9P3PXS0_LYOSH|nr:putative lipid particle protein [Lyophyllum shimeji]
MSSVHLLVLIHGMWGHPRHLAELYRIISEKYLEGLDGIELEVLLAETNREDSTYDGIDWGGERVAQEVLNRVDALEKDGKTVSRFSITGYSLGGLISRYVIGILHQKGFFDRVTPVNFNTLATPHIGLPRYPSLMSTLTSSLGPKLLSRTGEQFYLADKWSARGRPLIEVMADPDRIFHQALRRFEHIRIYANAVRDLTVPYVTSAIETEDPFALYETNGIEIELDEEYSPLIKSFEVPAIPPAPIPKPTMLSPQWFRSRKPARPFLPPALQMRFPLNIVLYSLLPLLVPVAISLVVVRFTLASRSSRARIRLMEEDDSKGQKLINILAELEDEVEHAVVDFVIDNPADSQLSSSSTCRFTGHRSSSPKPVPNTPALATKIDMVENGSTLPESTASASSSSCSLTHKKKETRRPPEPILTPVQLKVAGWLKQLPIKKELAYFPEVVNSHAMIVCRDVKRFEAHRRGEGILRHWADSFIL